MTQQTHVSWVLVQAHAFDINQKGAKMSKICTAVLILLIAAVGFSKTLSDQDIQGVQNKEIVTHHAGDRSLIETGGAPAAEPTDVSVIEGCDITSNTRIPGYVQTERNGSGCSPDWGNDILVIDDTLASDPFLLRDPITGYLYVVYKYMGPLIPANSSVTIVRSTNGGDTWDYIMDSWVDDTTEIYNLDAVIDTEGDSTFIFAICNAQDDDIWLFRYNITGDYSDWVEVTVGSVYDPAIDQQENPGSSYLYMAYLVNNTMLRFRASSDYGLTWTSSYDVATTDTYHSPDIRMNVGTNIWAYIIWDNGPITYSKANDWQGFAGWLGITEKIHNFRAGSDDVNPQISGGWGGDILWVVAEENINNSGDWNLVWDYTTDGNVWRCDTSFPDIDLSADPAMDEKYFRLMYDTNNPDYARVAYNTQTGPSDTRVDYQFYQNGWFLTTEISDHLSKVGTAPSVNYVPEGGGGAVVYAGYSAIWYDDYWLEVQETSDVIPSSNSVKILPNITSGYARLSYTVTKEGNVRISLFDAAGRVVNTLVNETKPAGEHTLILNNQNLSAGVYFIRVETQEGVNTESMTIVR